MKKIIVIAISCILTLSSFLFTACEKRIDNNENKSSEQTTAQTQNNTATEEKPMPIPAVKGKNARQLFEDAMSDYTSSKTFDVAMSMESTKDGEKTIEKIAYKINDTEMYLDIDMDEQDMTIWFVDNTVYLEMDGQKLKAVNTSVADVLGENFFDELLAKLPTDTDDIPEAYKKKMESAQIYSYKGTYYFSVTVTDAEAIEMELGDKGYTETMYFNSTGAIKKIVAKDSEETITVLINSYGKDVTITKPENADEFIEQPTTPPADPGMQDPATYAVYEQLLNTIDTATVYTMTIEMDGEPYIFYETDGKGGKYVGVYEYSAESYDMWIVKNQGYISQNGQYPQKTTVSSDMLQSFTKIENLRDQITDNRIQGEKMSDLKHFNTSNLNEKTLSFGVLDTTYTYVFTYGPSYIDVLVTKNENGRSETIKYIFDFISDPMFEVYAPI